MKLTAEKTMNNRKHQNRTGPPGFTISLGLLEEQELTAPPADHLHDGRREEAHSVCPSLAVMDVTLPPAVYVLLQHLQGAPQRQFPV